MTKYTLPTFTLFLILLIWYLIKTIFDIHDFILPAPHQIITAFISNFELLIKATLITFFGAGLGYLTAIIIGLSLSVFLFNFPLLLKGVYPWVIFMQMVPIISSAAIIVILFDVGLQSVATIAFVISVFPIIASTLQGLKSTPKAQIELFNLYKASRTQELLKLRIPYALPYFFTGAKISATLAVIGAVTGEIFAGSSNKAGGLGYLILIFKSELKVDAIYAATVICCLLGFLFVGTTLILRHLFLHRWHEGD